MEIEPPGLGTPLSRAPTGTVTLLFTDIVDSCAHWELDPSGMRRALQTHMRSAMDAVEEHGGLVFKTVGDAVCAAFPSGLDAIHAALRIQLDLRREQHEAIRLEVRSAIHTGAIEFEDGDYVGPTANRVARMVGVASGGQILVSDSTRAIAEDGGSFEWHDLGMVSLRGLKKPSRMFQLIHPDLPPASLGLPVLKVPHNLLEDERPFIGRAKERADVRRKLASGERLVTITGIGGIGKTSLARQVAVDSLEIFADGVWFVDCENLTSQTDLIAAIAEGMHLHSRSLDHLTAEVGDRRSLLILDCFERITELAPSVERLVRACPKLSVLVTSRVILGVAREFEYPLAPMGTTGKMGADSFSLFVEAARHVVDDFSASGRNRAYVRQICEALEGVPLAIVLAAGRLRMLGLADLLSQIRERRLEILHRHGPAGGRHNDIQDVISGSFQLLEPTDQALLTRLSVFRGGFFLESAEAVMAGRILNGLSRLRESSLIMTVPVGGRSRFRILDTVREYLAFSDRDLAAEVDLAEDARRHAEHFAVRAEAMHELDVAGSWDAFLDEFWAELGNLRMAIAYADLEGRTDLIERFAGALLRALLVIGLWDDFDHLAEAALKCARERGNGTLEAWVLMSRGTKHRRTGDEDAARKDLVDRADILRDLGDPAELADALSDLVEQSLDRGRLEEAEESLKELLALAQEHSASEVVGVAKLSELRYLMGAGRIDQARQGLDGAIDTARGTESLDVRLILHGQLAEVAWQLGEGDQAMGCAKESLRLAARGERMYSAVRTLLLLAEMELKMGNPAEATLALHGAQLAPIESKSTLAQRVVRAIRESSPECRELLRGLESEGQGKSWIDVSLALVESGTVGF